MRALVLTLFAATLTVRANDTPLLIELERRSGALAYEVNATGTTVVGTFEDGRIVVGEQDVGTVPAWRLSRLHRDSWREAMSRVDSVLAAVSITPAASSPGATWQPPNECHLSREVRGISVDPTDLSRVYAGSFYAAQPPDHCASELPPVEA